MKAVIQYGINDIRTQNVNKPTYESNEVLIKIKISNLSVSELNSYKGIRQRRAFPFIPGHEFSGIISEIGDDVSNLKVGDRVVAELHMSCKKCYYCVRDREDLCSNKWNARPGGTFTEYIVVPEEAVYKLPENVSLEEATLIEPLSTCISALTKSQLKIGDEVAIFGQGPMGLMLLQLCNLSGAELVYAIDLVDNRLDLSKKLGSTGVIDAKKEDAVDKILNETNNFGVDIVFEASGSPKAFEQAMKVVKTGGIIVQLGHIYEPVLMDALSLYYKELTLISARGEPYQYAIELMSSGKLKLQPLITHTMSFDQILQAYETLENKDKTNAIIVQLEEFP